MFIIIFLFYFIYIKSIVGPIGGKISLRSTTILCGYEDWVDLVLLISFVWSDCVTQAAYSPRKHVKRVWHEYHIWRASYIAENFYIYTYIISIHFQIDPKHFKFWNRQGFRETSWMPSSGKEGWFPKAPTM